MNFKQNSSDNFITQFSQLLFVKIGHQKKKRRLLGVNPFDAYKSPLLELTSSAEMK